MSAPSSRDWLTALAQLGADDLRRISRLVDLLITSDRATADTAHVMLAARPTPTTADEARERCTAIVAYLEQIAADDFDAGTL